MTTDVVLGASQRNVLLALQATQAGINRTQLRLSTGLRVNSALDDPQNFFQSRALSTRATQLNLLLDSIGQAVSTIEQASSAVTSVETFVTQAQSLANQAQDLTSASAERASITGNEDLSDASNLVADIADIDDGDQIIFSFVDSDDTIATSTVTITTGDSINNLLNDINNIVDSNTDQVFTAQLNSNNYLEISTQDGQRFGLEFQTSGNAANSDLARGLGLDSFEANTTDDDTAETRFTISGASSLNSISLFEENGGSGGSTATRTTSLIDLTNSASGNTGDIFNGDTGDALRIGINGGATVSVISDISTATVQDLIDSINNGSLNSSLEASFDETEGTLNIRPVGNDVTSIEFEIDEDAAGAGTAARANLQILGFGTQDLQSAADGNDTVSSETITLGSGGGTLSSLEDQFDTIRTQIDSLIADSSFNGINLLANDSLIVIFNEDRSNTLAIEGANLTTTGLGISLSNFGTRTSVASSISQTNNALATVRNFSSSLANDLAIIETRETFTQRTVNTLQEASDKLVVADQNEEGANLLALQTRQLLGVTALSLASVSQQSVLRLF